MRARKRDNPANSVGNGERCKFQIPIIYCGAILRSNLIVAFTSVAHILDPKSVCIVWLYGTKYNSKRINEKKNLRLPLNNGRSDEGSTVDK